jgi:uncharacterized membrane protein
MVEVGLWLLVSAIFVASGVTIHLAANRVDDWCDEEEAEK